MDSKTILDTWGSLQTKVSEAVKSHFPVETNQRKLELVNVSIEDKTEGHDDIRSQEAVKDAQRTWGVPVYGHLQLVDKNTGKILDKSRVKLMTLPKPTNRYSYIVDGSERQVSNLWRLRSGIYAHVKENGVHVAEFNLAKGLAGEDNVSIPFDPQKKNFNLKWGSTNVPLYTVLKTMGVPDEEMKKAWGEEIYKANAKSPERVQSKIRDLYAKTSRRGMKAPKDDQDSIASTIVREFQNTRLLPETTKAVLGKPIDHMSGEAMLLASKRILGVARQEIQPDDRNSLIFKSLHGTDDFLHEKLTNYKTARTIKNKVSHNIDKKDAKIRDIISSDLFGKPIRDFFSSSQLSQHTEQINPLDMLAAHRSTTIMGAEEGGIKSARTIKTSMKVVNPSHLGFLDPIHTPEGSETTGITLHLPLGVKKENNIPTIQVWDTKLKKRVRVSPAELHSQTVALPDQVKWTKTGPKALYGKIKVKDPKTHEVIERPLSDARYIFGSPHQLFDESSNLVPFLQNDQGNRSMMAGKQMTQAIALDKREAPLVQTKTKGGKERTWEEIIGGSWTHTSPVDGKVLSIKNGANNHPESVIVQGNDGKKHTVQLYNHFPLNDKKSFISADLKVKVGDQVKKDGLIADTNFTREGRLALGTNLRTAYLPFKGYNFEDGIVISETAANKLSSTHMRRMSLDIDPKKDVISKSKFQAYASTMAKKVTKEQLDKIGDDGVVAVGTKVEPGDILVASIGKRELTGESLRTISPLNKKLFEHKDQSVVWESDHPGEVVKVVRHPNNKGVTVHVKSTEPMRVGDKITGRHGNKGIVTTILPDHEMPRVGGPDREPIEVALNPSGVHGRINPGQLLEAAASKIAKKTGKPYLVENFSDPKLDRTTSLLKELKSHGISDTEELYDPTTKKKLGNVTVGYPNLFKLKQQVEKQFSVRGANQAYGIDHAPTGTGSASPGQTMGQLDFYSLLAHGARHNLREMATYKSSRQLGDKMETQTHIDFWHRVQTGQPLPAPKIPFVYKKFEGLLTGLGIDVKKEGNELQLTPLTDKGVLSLSAGEIKDPGRVLRAKDAKELEKGLFDIKVTGGLPNDAGKGLKWSHITLAEAMPNPIFVGTKQHPGPAVVLSGLKFDDFTLVAKGKKKINGKTGGEAISHILNSIDVQKSMKELQANLPKLSGVALDRAAAKVRYFKALDQLKLKPTEAYMMKYVPVLPPVFRPITKMPDGSLREDDVNFLYKNLGLINNKMKDPIKELGPSAQQPLREELYDALHALAGIGNKPLYDSNRPIRGILDTIAAPKEKQPKEGFFQSKLMSRRQDLSTRGTIIPEPSMHLDHVGIPRNAAMELYKPFVVHELRKLGDMYANPITALKAIKEDHPIANKALDRAMEQRPILLKRDPALHKFSIMAFKPKVVEGKAIKIHPLVTAGYNADFDGDVMSAYVPLTPEAVREASNMFPSNNLFSSTTGRVMYAPDQEAMWGLHLISKWGKKTDKKFSTLDEAMKAKQKGSIDPTDVILVGGKKTTLGRLMVAKHLPPSIRDNPDFIKQLQDPKFEILKKTSDSNKLSLNDVLTRIAKEDPHNFSSTVDNLKNIGNQHAYDAGATISLKDLVVPKKIRDQVLKKADSTVAKIKAGAGTKEEKREKIINTYTAATDELMKKSAPHFKKTKNNGYTMVRSGSKGKMDQFRQLSLAPMLLTDSYGNIIPQPIKKSYSEGLDLGDYWTTLLSSRTAIIQKAEGTSKPGALSKDIMNVMIPNMVVSKDCGTINGVSMNVHDSDVYDRVLAVPIKAGNRVIAEAGEIFTPHLASTLKKHKVDRVVVRSPLKCQHGQGICAKCYGLNENGILHDTGTNIGVIAGQSLGEPATQLSMRVFHTGGVASKSGTAASGFARLGQILGIPKVLPNAATLAKTSGKVSKIERDKATLGWNIHIGGERHYMPADRKPIVSVGQTIKKGLPLSTGNINPRHLLPLTDIHTVQNYLTNELSDKVYKDVGVRRRNVETVVRSMTNLTKVVDPGTSGQLHGDVMPRTVAEEHNRNLAPGDHPIVHRPILKGMAQVALDQHEDWMSRLNFQKLKQTLLEGAAQGWKTNLHGINPIPAYARGTEFGLGTPKKPYLY